jgi:hypothetical protein
MHIALTVFCDALEKNVSGNSDFVLEFSVADFDDVPQLEVERMEANSEKTADNVQGADLRLMIEFQVQKIGNKHQSRKVSRFHKVPIEQLVEPIERARKERIRFAGNVDAEQGDEKREDNVDFRCWKRDTAELTHKNTDAWRKTQLLTQQH